MRRLAVFAVFAAFWQFGQHLLELGHALTVEHARCAEHGELLHIGADPAKPDPAAQVRPDTPLAQADHDHCSVEWLARFQIGTADPELETVPAEPSRSHHLAALAIPEPRPLLRLAPKTSPPNA